MDLESLTGPCSDRPVCPPGAGLRALLLGPLLTDPGVLPCLPPRPRGRGGDAEADAEARVPSGGWRKRGAWRRAQGLTGGAGTLTQVATFTGEIRGPCPHCGLQAAPSPKLEYAATDTRRGLSQPRSRCWVNSCAPWLRAPEEKGLALGSRLVLATGPQVQVLTSQGPQAWGPLPST